MCQPRAAWQLSLSMKRTRGAGSSSREATLMCAVSETQTPAFVVAETLGAQQHNLVNVEFTNPPYIVWTLPAILEQGDRWDETPCILREGVSLPERGVSAPHRVVGRSGEVSGKQLTSYTVS